MQRRIRINGEALGWRERILFGFIAVVWIVLGLVFGALLMGLGAVASLGLAARIWWLRRRLRRGDIKPGTTVIDGEYRVLEGRAEARRGGSQA